MSIELKIALIYFAVISFFAVFFTVYDKIAAKCKSRRIPERTLFTISAFGGSVFMYLTMITIRHKTKHKSFMIGIPAIIIAQLLLLITAVILFF